MALNTSLLPRASWLEAADWQGRAGAAAIQQGLQAGIQMSQFQQQQALRVKEMLLREQQQSVLNQTRLEAIEDRAMQLADLDKIRPWLKDPSQAPPTDLQSPDSFRIIEQAQANYAKSQAGRAWMQSEKAFWDRFGELAGDDQAALMDMLRQTRGQVTQDIFTYAGEAWERSPVRRRQYAPTEITKLYEEAEDADLLGDTDRAETLRERAKRLSAITTSTRFSDVDRLKAGALQREIDRIDKTLEDPVAARFAGPGEMDKLRQRRAERAAALETILRRYEIDTPAAQPSAQPAPAQPEGATVKPAFRFEPGVGLVPVK